MVTGICDDDQAMRETMIGTSARATYDRLVLLHVVEVERFDVILWHKSTIELGGSVGDLGMSRSARFRRHGITLTAAS